MSDKQSEQQQFWPLRGWREWAICTTPLLLLPGAAVAFIVVDVRDDLFYFWSSMVIGTVLLLALAFCATAALRRIFPEERRTG